ncbi:MAG: phage portal protein [Pseudomonadota bacterium]|nr:phage portal protein [Pseudomonadota bacterium]
MWLDDVIGFFSPMAGFKRRQARMALDLTRAYEGAKVGRRTDSWFTPSTSANTEIYVAGRKLRDRARDIVRNNPYGKKARRIFSDNFVGTGIIPQARVASDRLNKQIMAAWNQWSSECDYDGNCDFYGLQAQIVRAMFESGECFVRYRDRMSADDNSVPMQLQVLEADFLDLTKNYEMPDMSGYIRQGIEFDKNNKRVAYWMWPVHPGDTIMVWPRLNSVRIPADQILHIFEKDRPGQIRGVTSFASVINRLKDLDDYDDAELWRKKIESCFAAFVIQNSGSEGPVLGNIASTGPTDATNPQPSRVETFRPGMIEYLKPGEDVRFGNPTSDANYPSYQRVQLHAIAAGLGVTYEQLTGDLSQVNYSSLRAGLLEFRRSIETLRWQVFIPMFCVPVWKRFIERAYINGLISKIDYGVSWTPPKFEMIDPLKDAQADTWMMRNGTLTLREAIANRGFDPDTQIDEIAATNAKLDEKKIILDCDPRHITQAGISQPSPKGDPTDEPHPLTSGQPAH